MDHSPRSAGSIEDAAATQAEHEQEAPRFRGGRLLAIWTGVVVALALVSALVDWVVLGALNGRI